MALSDPVAAYTAANDIEAHLVVGMLVDAGIEAAVVDDVSRVGWTYWGQIPALYRPQVWIDRQDIERARPVLEAYMAEEAQRRAANRATADESDAKIVVRCEECGKQSEYPAAQNGTVQNCTHCFAYVDVGDNDVPGWNDAGQTDE
jgi:hypothetical protein